MELEFPGMRELLKSVSRSFYLSMVWLPENMRRGIGLGYLLARATDSVADTSRAGVEERMAVLRRMDAAIADPFPSEVNQELVGELAKNMAPAQAKEGEKCLLSRFGECLVLLRCLPEGERELVQEVLHTIIAGQIWDLEFFVSHAAVESEEQVRQYTYQVAGCVGRFWTRLGRETLGDAFCPKDRCAILEQAAERYGRGLQLVNILRDIREDAGMGRCYLPGSREHWLCRAERLLADGVDYSRRLGMFRLRLTAMLPALLGRKTLELLKKHDPGKRVKISRRAVYASLVKAIWLSIRQQGA